MLNQGRNKQGQMEGELNTDAQKGYLLRVTVEMWESRAWSYEGDRESKARNVLQESMLRWWRRKLTREFAQVLRRILGSWKHMVSKRGIIEVVG